MNRSLDLSNFEAIRPMHTAKFFYTLEGVCVSLIVIGVTECYED
jgi:hypothetical protein